MKTGKPVLCQDRLGTNVGTTVALLPHLQRGVGHARSLAEERVALRRIALLERRPRERAAVEEVLPHQRAVLDRIPAPKNKTYVGVP